jgi:carbon monoxide dehydrogenase subunit G
MSSLSIEERFTLDAPPGAVWSFLTDPQRVVGCLPGAELTGQDDEATYKGSMKVSAGPVTIVYRGTAVFEEIDEERRYVRIVGRGREKSGSGNASMTMESQVEGIDGGGTAVSVTADVKVTGKIVRFGRGMIESVSAEMFSDFTKRLEERVGAEQEARADEEAQAKDDAQGGAVDGSTVADRESSSSAADAKQSQQPLPSPTDAAAPGGPTAPSASSEESLAILPLLWRAFKRWLRDLFG